VFLLVALVGLIGPWLYFLRGRDIGLPADERTSVRRSRLPFPGWPVLIVPLAPLYLVAALLIRLGRDRRLQTVPIWLLILGIIVAPLGLVLVAVQDRDRPIAWGAGFGSVGVVAGALLMVVGMGHDSAAPFAIGLSFVLFGLAMILRFFDLSARPVFTITGVLVLVAWGLLAGARLGWLVGRLEGDIEMFFLSGIAMVAASTFVLIYNSDLILALLSGLGGMFGGLLPAMKTAVAYPLAFKFRTGMTLAMISLVVFALTMMSTMNLNFNRIFLADTARGGWDVTVDENPNNPIEDLPAALAAAGSSVQDGFRVVGQIKVDTTSQVNQVALQADTGEDGTTSDYPVLGVDEGFVDGGDVLLSTRARGYDSDEAVWEAMKGEEHVAIVDGFTVSGGGAFAEDTFSISGIDSNAAEFDPVFLNLSDPVTGRASRVRVIGVIDFGASATFRGIYVPDAIFEGVFGEPDVSLYYVGLKNPDDAKAAAQDIESSLLTAGVQAESLKARIEDDQALSSNFFLLMQAFMGLGLFVGIAAVGVIAFRTVVERRQQIGMLRAIGYKRSTVALSFMMESSFITLLAVLSGVGLALWLSFFLITSDEFPDVEAFYIPWDRIILISAFTYGASLVMTFIPSRQAASVPTAEALRYE
jgi:putative ABC transport system permease protein